MAVEIEARLDAALNPVAMTISDDSAHHVGHTGHDARGESHFTVEIETAAFTGLSRVARQRLVNEALRELLAERVHALRIVARAPGEKPSRA